MQERDDTWVTQLENEVGRLDCLMLSYEAYGARVPWPACLDDLPDGKPAS